MAINIYSSLEAGNISCKNQFLHALISEFKVGANYSTNYAGIKKPGGLLFGTGWQYWNGQEWADDDVLLEVQGERESSSIVLFYFGCSENEPHYPDVVKVSSEGGASWFQGSRMGAYKRMETLYQNGRPVYKQEDGTNYIFAGTGYSMAMIFLLMFEIL